MTKLIVVLGATGKQGGSVIDEFLKDPSFKIRGVTRDPSSEAGRALASRGVDVVKGDLLDLQSLIEAFKGANIVYGVTTDFWSNMPLVGPATSTRTVLEKSYDMELLQGQNIVKAVLPILNTTLERFIISTLSATKKISKGKYTHVYHFDAKSDVVDDIVENHPELAKKTSTLQLGYFASNFQFPTPLHPEKQADGSYVISACGPGDAVHPFIDPIRDPAAFVYAIATQPPANEIKVYLGNSEMISFNSWAKLLSRVLNVEVRYKELSIEEFNERMKGFHDGVGRELGEMYAYGAEFGFDGGVEGVRDIQEILKTPTPSMEQLVRSQDWTSLI